MVGGVLSLARLGLGLIGVAACIRGLFNWVQYRAQATRSCANCVSSSNVRVGGASMHILPGRSISHCSWTASFTSRGPGSLRRCPSHLYLRFLIASTRSYVCLYLLASSWADLPVNLDRHLAFAPLIRACVRGVNLTNGLSRDPLQHSDVTIVTPLRIEHD